MGNARARWFFQLSSPFYGLVERALIPEYRAVAARLPIARGTAALDLGTGTGLFALVLAERGCRVTGVDFSSNLLRRARRRLPEQEFRRLDLAGLAAIADGSFDLVTLAMVLHGLEEPLRASVLRNAARIARSAVLIIDYARPGTLLVRIIERAEGPAYRSFLARPTAHRLREAGLCTEHSGHLAHSLGYWWSTPAADDRG